MRIRLNHQRLLELIRRSRISQNHWAIRLGLSRGHWSNIVRGKHPYPSGKTRGLLLDVFDVPFEELFSYEGSAGADAALQAAIADRYLLDREIGQGGMGTVYLARDVRLARPVALKVVSDEAVSGIGAEQFLREIRYAARLRHHHILPLHDAGVANGYPYYAMPFVDDGSLRERLVRVGPLPVDEVQPLVEGIARGLQYAHERQVLHCDVKPENVLLSDDHVYIADFGIARAIHAEARVWGRGRRGDLDTSAGTPAYVSPEQAAGDTDLDGRSDIYSLGCVMFEMLSGAPPFEGTRTMDVVAQRFVETPSLARRAPQVSSAVIDVVHRAMAVDPADRHEDAATFVRDLRQATSRGTTGFVGWARGTRAGVVQALVGPVRKMTSKRGGTVMDQFRLDVRQAFRSLVRQPALSMVMVLTLALGIGANTAIFSIINGILLDPLPFPDPDRVMVIREVDGDGDRLQVAPPNFQDWRDRSRSFSSLSFSMFLGPQSVIGGVTPVRATVERVGQGFFEVFGVSPLLGRSFSDRENALGGDPVIVVSHTFWQNHLGGSADLAHHTLDVGGTRYQVIGVMPPDFRFQGAPDIWVPAERFALASSRTTHALRVVGRLAPGVTAADSRRELENILADIRVEAPATTAESVFIVSLQEEVVGSSRRPLHLLAGAAGLLLIIACANVASTLLARGEGRRREFLMRSALGAQRGRLVRQLLTESLVVATAGAAAGLGLAVLLVAGLNRVAATALARADNIGLDLRVLGFAGAMTLVTTFLVGLWPALRGAGGDAAAAFRTAHTGASRVQRTSWSALVVTEVALACVLLIGSAVLIRSFWSLVRVDAGFEASGVLTVEYSLPASSYDEAAVPGFHDRLLEEMRSLPGVRAAGLVNDLPLSGESMFTGIRRAESSDWVRGDYRLASVGYFEAMGTPILRGRPFLPTDGQGDLHAVVINERLAGELWPDEDPLGQQVMLSGNDRQWDTPLEVVGVVPAVRHRRLASLEPPTYYVNYRQRPLQGRTVVAALRVEGRPEALVRTVRDRITALDRDVPVEFATMVNRVSNSVARDRFTVLVLSAFAAVAVALAMVGIFGVISYAVARRTREFGIRLALGARPSAIRGMILRQSMTVVAVGAGVGAVIALYATRFVRSLVFEAETGTWGTYILVLGVLGGTAVLASWIPARRATRADPLAALRAE